MNFGGKISYRDPNRTLKHLYFTHTLSVSDILRPLVITTEEFAQKWTNASFEKKQKMSSSLKNCQDLSEKAEHTLKFHLVEIIGKCLRTDFTGLPGVYRKSQKLLGLESCLWVHCLQMT